MTTPDYGIKPLTTTRIPKSHIFLFAVSKLGGDRAGYSQTWRGAAASYRWVNKGGALSAEELWYDTEKGLWSDVDIATGSKGLHILWCHDLSWTARVTGMLKALPGWGFSLTAFNLTPGGSWMSWKRDRATLKVVDIMSIWPMPMAKLAALFGLPLKAIPEWDARSETWMSYGWSGMKLVRDAATAYMSWLASEDLGSLAVTGNGQAFNAFRRRFMPSGILVHHNEEARAMEREAAYTGRCEAWYRGTVVGDAVDEWDFSNAHTNIALTERVPVWPVGDISGYAEILPWFNDPDYTVLAEVEVDTPEPAVPTRIDGRIVWPTGKFVSTLWAPELLALNDSGGTYTVRKAWLYRTAPVLNPWAAWILAQLESDDVTVPAWRKTILKRWGNVLVGRFGMRYPKWRHIGESVHSDAFYLPVVYADTGEETAMTQVGHDLFETDGVTEPRYAAPMITSYVMSVMRARLWYLIDRVPANAVLYMDTDSILVPRTYRAYMQRATLATWLNTLRLKRTWDHMTILGPRQVIAEGGMKIAGLPGNAKPLGGNEFEAEVTESLMQSLATQQLSSVRSAMRTFSLGGKDERREGTGIGWTKPFHINNI